MGLWIWDWAIDPRAAPDTLGLRLGMAACLVPCIVALQSQRVGAKAFTILLYASVLATEVFWLAILRRLDGGLIYGIGGYMYYVLGVLVIGLPLRFRDNVLGLTVVLLVPDLAAAGGWLPGFSYAKYNALIVPAGGLSLFTFWAFTDSTAAPPAISVISSSWPARTRSPAWPTGASSWSPGRSSSSGSTAMAARPVCW